jgi:hypothetical protein
MKVGIKKPKLTLESLLKESQVITGKDMIKKKEDKIKELVLFKEAQEFEQRYRRPRAGEEKIEIVRLQLVDG